MFLGLNGFSWIVVLICAGIAFLYVYISDSAKAKKENRKMSHSGPRYLAILCCFLIALISTIISKFETFIGSPMLALIIGILIVNLVPADKMSSEFKGGTTFAGKSFLSAGIIGLGATLAFTDIFSAVYALPLIIFNILLALAVGYLLGRKVFHVSSNTCALVSSGTCICGGTAIAAVSRVIRAKEEETAYAMTAIFLFDLLACLSYPYLALQMGLSDVQFGFLAGTAINDTSSVVAAQETFANLKGLEGYALPAAIKVVRTTMIIVMALLFSIVTLRKDAAAKTAPADSKKSSIGAVVWKSFPKFILFFILAVGINTILVNTVSGTPFYKELFKPFFSFGYKFFVTMALAGVGFKIRFRDLFTKGLKPIALGGCVWLALFLSSLAFTLLFAERML